MVSAGREPMKCALNLCSCIASCSCSFRTICKVEGTRLLETSAITDNNLSDQETGKPESKAWLCRLQFQIYYSSPLMPTVLGKGGFLIVPSSSGYFEK